MKKIKLGILFGGRSGEHEVSIVSALGVYQALDKNKYDVTLIGIDKTGRWLQPKEAEMLMHKDNPRLIELNKQKNTVALPPFESKSTLIPIEGNGNSVHLDVILPILHGSFGEDGTVQGLLQLANIPFVGSGVLGSSICMDKDVAKRLLNEAKIPVVPYVSLKKHEFKNNPVSTIEKISKTLGLPFFVKPANAGSSVGVHKVKSFENAKAQFDDAFQFDDKVLCEKAISARELEVSVLGNDEAKASIVGEIIPNAEFYTYEAKYIDENGASLNIPAKIDQKVSKEVQEMAIKAFKTLECKGMARVDFFLDKDNGQLYINELNTIPGFTPISMYPKLWEASGLKFSDLLDKLIELALDDHKKRNSLKFTYDVK